MKEMINTFLSPGSLLETEHGLIMILILYGLLIYRGNRLSKWVPVVIFSGIALSLFTPVHEINLFWPILTGLVVPPLLWQGAVAVTKSGPLRRNWSLVIWSATLLLVTFSLYTFSRLPFSISLLLGVLILTLVWYFREFNVERSYLSTIGFITLIVLLVEIDLAYIDIGAWFGTLASGTAIGIILGFSGVAIFRKLKGDKWKNVFFFIWAYLAYLIGFVFDTSAIATTLAAALVVSTYGFSIGLWYRAKDIPVPANVPFFFFLSATIWIILGWQTHTVLDPAKLNGVLPTLAAVAVGILLVRRFVPISTENRLLRLLRQEFGVFLLLIGTVLYWPQQAFLSTTSVEIALAGAVFLILILRFSIKPFFDLIGIQLSWPSKQ